MRTLCGSRKYLLIEQSFMDVCEYRQTAGGWDMAINTDGAVISLHSVELEIATERIYESALD